MAHINWDTLQDYMSTHKMIHDLLKRYHENQDVTEEELIHALEVIKDSAAEMITAWKQYLGHCTQGGE